MGLVYKLVSCHEPKVYVGKTTQTHNERFRSHKKDYNQWLVDKHHYVTSFELIKYDDCVIIVLEDNIPDDMLPQRERYWYDLLDCVNKCIPNRTPAEWRQDNLEYIKQYYQNNREYHKQYRQDNRETLLEYQKQYRQNNKEKISEKVTCNCGCIISRSNMSTHVKSNKHKSLIDNQTLILS